MIDELTYGAIAPLVWSGWAVDVTPDSVTATDPMSGRTETVQVTADMAIADACAELRRRLNCQTADDLRAAQN